MKSTIDFYLTGDPKLPCADTPNIEFKYIQSKDYEDVVIMNFLKKKLEGTDLAGVSMGYDGKETTISFYGLIPEDKFPVAQGLISQLKEEGFITEEEMSMSLSDFLNIKNL